MCLANFWFNVGRDEVISITVSLELCTAYRIKKWYNKVDVALACAETSGGANDV